MPSEVRSQKFNVDGKKKDRLLDSLLESGIAAKIRKAATVCFVIGMALAAAVFILSLAIPGIFMSRFAGQPDRKNVLLIVLITCAIASFTGVSTVGLTGLAAYLAGRNILERTDEALMIRNGILYYRYLDMRRRRKVPVSFAIPLDGDTSFIYDAEKKKVTVKGTVYRALPGKEMMDLVLEKPKNYVKEMYSELIVYDYFSPTLRKALPIEE